jgi:hypothetical protein
MRNVAAILERAATILRLLVRRIRPPFDASRVLRSRHRYPPKPHEAVLQCAIARVSIMDGTAT